MKVIRSDKEIFYSGRELRPHFIYQTTKQWGDALLIFEGGCLVQTNDLVDWEDRIEGDFIQSKMMLHLLMEVFGAGIQETVWIQRFLISFLLENLNRKQVKYRRSGDDLFLGETNQKLSVSIATVNPVSGLIHVGLNLDSVGAPVPTSNLSIEEKNHLIEILTLEWPKEVLGVQKARCKVIPH